MFSNFHLWFALSLAIILGVTCNKNGDRVWIGGGGSSSWECVYIDYQCELRVTVTEVKL